MRERMLAAANGDEPDRPPVWMMRQAGRYLPEYREIRADYSFVDAISTPEIATEISLQPWERFRPDGVVMYSDILTALEPLGISYRIESGVGPVIERPVTTAADVPEEVENIDDAVPYVGELLERLGDHLGARAAVIGFVGGPFTLAAYLVEGKPARSFMGVRSFMRRDPEGFQRLLDVLTDVLTSYVSYQVDHGADVIQLFDTYAGLVPTDLYRAWILPAHRAIIDAAPVPTIVFARNMNGRLDLLEESGADVVGLDWTVDLATARSQLGSTPVQGNLDPAVLFAEPVEIQSRTRELIEAGGGAGHIINLGHGVDKSTPVEGVAAFFEAVAASGS